MQILFLGLTISSSWGNGHATPYRALLTALHRQGIRTIFYERDAPYYARHRDFTQCPYCELVLYEDWNSIRESVLAQSRLADVVVTGSYLPEGARISRELLEARDPLHVFYDLDTPVTLGGFASGKFESLEPELIAQFDLYLSFTGGKVLDRLKREFGARLVQPLYGCVDPDVYRQVPKSQKFDCSLSYMGTYAADRKASLQELFLTPAANLSDARFLLAGSMYPAAMQVPCNVRRMEHVAPDEHPEFYSSSGATLNLTRAEMAASGYCPSGRFFEASACGAPILTDTWEGLDHFFAPGEELFVVSRAEDVLEILRRAGPELPRRAQRARERTLDEHTGQRRAQQFLAYCEEARHRKQSTVEVLS